MSLWAVSWEHLAILAHLEVVIFPSNPSSSRLSTLIGNKLFSLQFAENMQAILRIQSAQPPETGGHPRCGETMRKKGAHHAVRVVSEVIPQSRKKGPHYVVNQCHGDRNVRQVGGGPAMLRSCGCFQRALALVHSPRTGRRGRSPEHPWPPLGCLPRFGHWRRNRIGVAHGPSAIE